MYPNLKLQIWRSGIHQSRLARELSIDETLLSRIINGYREPSAGVKSRIAKYFQLDPEWLFQTDSESFPKRVPRNGSSREQRKW